MEWASKAYSPSAVRVEPLIHLDSTPEPEEKAKPSPQKTEPTHRTNHTANDGKRGDILIRGVWQRGQDCIVDTRVTDLDCKSNRNQDLEKVLKKNEKQKKAKYLQHCLKQRRAFVPFVITTDGMLGREANNLIKTIARRLAEKWQQPYSLVCGMMRARISIATARTTHLCLRGSRVPASKISRKVNWEDGFGVGLFETDY